MTITTTYIVQYSHPHTPGKWWTFGTDGDHFLFYQFEDAVEQAMKVGDIYAGNPWYRRIVNLETREVLWQRNGSVEVQL